MRIGSIVAMAGCGTLSTYSDDGEEVPLVPGYEPWAPDHAEPDGDDFDGDGAVSGEDCDDDDEAVYPGARNPCGDDFDADCDGEDCLQWTEDFEDAVLAASWRGGGPRDWQVLAIGAHQGQYSAANGPILDGQSSRLQLTLNLPAGGVVSFWHQGSTEPTYNVLQFTVDGQERGRWSGLWAWEQTTETLPRGVHELVWAYTKDVSTTGGQDTVLIDDVVVEGGTPSE